jgi:hypothetical protein
MTATKQKITGLGYDEAFGGIDLSGCPSLQTLSSDDWTDDRFAPLDRRGNGNALKEFIKQQTAEHTPPTTVHANGSEFRVFYRDNLWYADGDVSGTRRRFSASDRDALLSKLGQITKPQNAYHALTKDEELQVIRACQSGDKLTGIGLYLAFSIGQARASQYNSPLEMMYDAALVPIMDKCANFCWFHSHPHALDTPGWHTYKNRILAGRPVTFDLLDAIWLRYQNHLENERTQSTLRQIEAPDEPEETPRESLEKLNALGDDEIDDLMHGTQRQFAREARAGRR